MRILLSTGRTCGEYQALPLAERSPEDAPLLELAGREGWKPCHFCSVITDRWEGCYHIVSHSHHPYNTSFHLCGYVDVLNDLLTRFASTDLYEL